MEIDIGIRRAVLAFLFLSLVRAQVIPEAISRDPRNAAADLDAFLEGASSAAKRVDGFGSAGFESVTGMLRQTVELNAQWQKSPDPRTAENRFFGGRFLQEVGMKCSDENLATNVGAKLRRLFLEFYGFEEKQ